jgi:hypothetical protein
MAQGRPLLPSHRPRLPTGRLLLPGPLLTPSGEAGGCLDGRSPRAQQAFGPPGRVSQAAGRPHGVQPDPPGWRSAEPDDIPGSGDAVPRVWARAAGGFP